MDKIAFVFAGQGAQAPGMGRDLYDNVPAARRVMDRAEARCAPNPSPVLRGAGGGADPYRQRPAPPVSGGLRLRAGGAEVAGEPSMCAVFRWARWSPPPLRAFLPFEDALGW